MSLGKVDINSIKGAFLNKKDEAVTSDNYVASIYHGMMKTYGYISYNEFKDMSLFLTIDLLNIIRAENDKQQSQHNKNKIKRGARKVNM